MANVVLFCTFQSPIPQSEGTEPQEVGQVAESTAGGDTISAKDGMVLLAFGEKRLKTKDQGTKEMSCQNRNRF